jgi:hypothetical protein
MKTGVSAQTFRLTYRNQASLAMPTGIGPPKPRQLAGISRLTDNQVCSEEYTGLKWSHFRQES